MNIKDKKAIVLGGTSGIGLSIAQQLSDAGATVIAGSRREVELPGIETVSVDVQDRDALSELFEKHRRFDILVNAATGGDREVKPLLDMDLDRFQGTFAKLWGYVNSVKLAAPYMASDGCMVLISGYPARKWRQNMLAIGTVGGAVEAFVRHAACELKPLRINAVSPGIIDTPMSPLQGEQRQQNYENLTRNNLIPRAGTAAEVASAAMFLIENDFVSGTIVDVDGGAILGG